MRRKNIIFTVLAYGCLALAGVTSFMLPDQLPSSLEMNPSYPEAGAIDRLKDPGGQMSKADARNRRSTG